MEFTTAKPEAKPRRLRDEMRSVMTMLRYKRSSIAQYLGFCHAFAAFHHRDPREMREPEIRAFLTYLAEVKKVAWSTQHSAMCAIVCYWVDLPRQVTRFSSCSVNQICPGSRTLIGLPRFPANAAHAGRDFFKGAAMKNIPLTQGYTAFVDDDDFERVSQYKWHAVRLGRRKTPYAKRTDYSRGRKNPRQVFLHHFITGSSGLVDHKNGNTLDDQKENLRPCSRQQNGFNRTVTSKQNGKPTRFKGICWHRRIEKWQANICLNRRKIHIGYFASEESAASAYNQKAVELFGEFAAVNNLARKPAECIKSPLDQISMPVTQKCIPNHATE